VSAALALTDAQLLVASWRTGVLSLPEDRIPCPGMIMREAGPYGRWGVWGVVRTMMLRFIDQWGEEAEALGWSTESLFGVHHLAGALRADSTGVLVSVHPWKVVAMNERTITLARGKTRSVFRGLTNPGESIPVWAFRPVSRGK
jgi:hypothetical protein